MTPYPLAYWPHDYAARLAANPKNEFEQRLRTRLQGESGRSGARA